MPFTVYSLCDLDHGTDIAMNFSPCLGLASEEWARSLKQFTSYSLSLHHISHSSYFFGGAQSVLAK